MTDHINELCELAKSRHIEFAASLEYLNEASGITPMALRLMHHETRTVLRKLFEATLLIEDAAAAAVRLEMLAGAYQEENA